MAHAWVQVNRVASQQLVAVLSGRGGKQRRRRRQQRPGHPRPRAPGGRRQAGPGRARADDRGQDPHRPYHVRAVPVQEPGEGPERLPAHQRPENRAADRDPGAARPRRVRRPGAPAGADRRRARVRRLHAGSRRRAGDRPGHLPEQRARQRARGRGRRRVRHPGPVHQDRAAHPAGGRPDCGRRRVLHRAVGGGGGDPVGVLFRPRLAAPPRRIRTACPPARSAPGPTRTGMRCASGRWRWPR